MSGLNYKYELTRNLTQAPTLANIWLISGKKIVQVDLNTRRTQFYANCGTYISLTQGEDKTLISKSTFSETPSILFSVTETNENFVATSRITK